MPKVILIGEPMVMFYATEYGPLEDVSAFKKGVAGAEVNVGIGLTRLGHKVSYLTKLSDDSMGNYVYKYLEKEKLISKLVLRDKKKPIGIMYKNKVKKGDPDTLYYRRGSAASTLSVSDVKNINFNNFDVLHMTGIPSALSETLKESCFYMIDKAKEENCLITFDPNLRPALWSSEDMMIETINKLAMKSDVFLPGLEEAKLLSGLEDINKISDFYLNSGIKLIIIKNGDKGAFYKNNLGECGEIEGYIVDDIIDTVGAGDGFAVGVIDGILKNKRVTDYLINANAIGAIQIQHESDNEALPTSEELTEFKKNNKRNVMN